MGTHAGDRLLVRTSDSAHYVYPTLHPDAGPLSVLTAPLAPTSGREAYYTKSCFSPDGHHVLAGCKSNKAYILEVRVCTFCVPCIYVTVLKRVVHLHAYAN